MGGVPPAGMGAMNRDERAPGIPAESRQQTRGRSRDVAASSVSDSLNSEGLVQVNRGIGWKIIPRCQCSSCCCHCVAAAAAAIAVVGTAAATGVGVTRAAKIEAIMKSVIVISFIFQI